MLKHKATFSCDACGTEYMIDENLPMELPPGWMLIQPSVANSEGFVADYYREVWFHFCSTQCMQEFMLGDKFLDVVVNASHKGDIPYGDDDEEEGDSGKDFSDKGDD